MPPRFSIITVCRNSAATLGETMESVWQQEFRDFEYIVIDGASTDGTLELLRESAGRFRGQMRWVSEPDAGIYDAMNKGLKLAQGDVIGFLNADDFFADATVLGEIAGAFDGDSGIDAVHGSLNYINAERRIVRRWRGCAYKPGAFQRGWMPAHPTFYCKRCCFEQYGAFDTGIGSAADFELMLRFIEVHRIRTSCLPLTFVYMRMGGASTRGLRAVWRNTRQNQAAFRRNALACPWHYPISRFFSKFSITT